MSPDASILLPVRNGAKHLDEALDSILDAPGCDIEVIVVDDGSTDETATLLEERSARDRRVCVHRTEPLGIVPALNLAIDAARAPVVVRMDADDRSLPGRIQAQLELLEARRSVTAVGTGVALHPDGMARLGMRRYVSWLNSLDDTQLARDIWVECPLAHPTIAFRRQALIAAGGYRQGPFPEDYELLLRLDAGGARFAKVPEILYWWRDHEPRLSRNDDRYAPAAFRRLKVERLLAGPLLGRKELVVWGAGKTGRPFAAELRRQGARVTHWIDIDPKKIGRTLHDAPVLPISELASIRGTPIVVAVGAVGARGLIRLELAAGGFAEGSDYFVVA